MENRKIPKEHRLKDGNEEKLLSLLGFAARARQLVCGADLCRDSIRRGKVTVAIVTADASENTKKRINDACKYYGTCFCGVSITSDELSARIGKSGSVAAVGVTDMNFAKGILALTESF